MVSERVGAIFEIIDDATPTLQKVKGGIQEIDVMMKRWDSTTKRVTRSKTTLIDKMTVFNQRIVLATISITALTLALIRYAKESIKAAEASERLKESLKEEIKTLDVMSLKHQKNKGDLGAFLITFKAWIADSGLFISVQEKANLTLELNTKIMDNYKKIVEETMNPLDEISKAVKDYEEKLKATGAAQEFINLAVENYRKKLEDAKIAEEALIKTEEKHKEVVNSLAQGYDDLNKRIGGAQSLSGQVSARFTSTGNVVQDPITKMWYNPEEGTPQQQLKKKQGGS